MSFAERKISRTSPVWRAPHQKYVGGYMRRSDLEPATEAEGKRRVTEGPGRQWQRVDPEADDGGCNPRALNRTISSRSPLRGHLDKLAGLRGLASGWLIVGVDPHEVGAASGCRTAYWGDTAARDPSGHHDVGWVLWAASRWRNLPPSNRGQPRAADDAMSEAARRVLLPGPPSHSTPQGTAAADGCPGEHQRGKSECPQRPSRPRRRRCRGRTSSRCHQ